MAILYTKKHNIKLNSSFSITNTEPVIALSITVITSPNAKAKVILYNNYMLFPGQTLEIKPTILNIYKVTIHKYQLSPSINETAVEYFTYIDDLTEYFIKDSLKLLCGDDCTNCDKVIDKDCDEKHCDPNYQLFNQMIYLNHWYGSTGNNLTTSELLRLSTELYSTSVIDDICDSTVKAKLLGENCCDNQLLFKKSLIIFYASFYFNLKKYIDDNTSTLDEVKELELLNEKFELIKFSHCIKNYGYTLELLEQHLY